MSESTAWLFVVAGAASPLRAQHVRLAAAKKLITRTRTCSIATLRWRTSWRASRNLCWLESTWRTARATGSREVLRPVGSVPGNAEDLNCGASSACGFDPDRIKVNQDAYFVNQFDAGGAQWLQVGVLDGHGKKGHLVASALEATLPEHVARELRAASAVPGDALVRAFSRADAEAIAQPSSTDARLSGAACAVALVRLPASECSLLSSTSHVSGLEVTVANAGDCQVLLGRRVGDGSWKAMPLSRPSTCRIPEERVRVEACGGRVDPNFVVWAGPFGVAMSRSLGDGVLRPFGVICEPEVSTWSSEFLASWDFLLLTSDGVGDVFTGDEAVAFVGACLEGDRGSLQHAAEALVTAARERWQADLPMEVRIDDATAVVVPLSWHGAVK